MKALIVLLSGLLFASCMHMGMPMTAGNHQMHQRDAVLETEVTSGDIRAVGSFPPMEAGRQHILTLKLSNTVSRTPVTGAEVYFHAAAAHQDGSSSHDDGGTHGVDITREVMERGEDPGTYTVSYSSSEAGVQDLTFHVTSVDEQRLEPPLVISARRIVADAPGNRHGGTTMGSGHFTSASFIIGGAAMAAMMILMFAR